MVVRCALRSSHRKRGRDRGRGIVRCPGQRTCGAGGSGRHRMGFARCFGRGGWRGRRSPRDPRRVAGAGEPAGLSRSGPGPVRARRGAHALARSPGMWRSLRSLLSPSVRVGGGLDRGAPTPNFLGEPATAAVPSCYTHRSSPRRLGGQMGCNQLANLCWILVEGLCSSLLLHNVSSGTKVVFRPSPS